GRTDTARGRWPARGCSTPPAPPTAWRCRPPPAAASRLCWRERTHLWCIAIPRNKPPRPRHRESVRATRERDRQAAPIERGRVRDALILRRPRGVLIRGLDAATAPARGS